LLFGAYAPELKIIEPLIFVHLPVKLYKAILLVIIFLQSAINISFSAPYVFFEDKNIEPAQPALFPTSQTRNVISLSGQWLAMLPDGTQANINVPSCYNFEGITRFETKVFLPDSMETQRFKLVCDGINNQCRILINDQFVHFQGVSSSRFSTDILPKFLKFGQENKVTFEVDNRLHTHRTIPTKPVAFSRQNFGGIFRGVYLVSEPEINIDDLNLEYSLSQDSLKLNMDIKLSTYLSSDSKFLNDTTSNKNISCAFTLSLDTQIVYQTPALFEFQPEREQILLKDTTLSFTDIISWGPRYPVRYTLTLSLIDQQTGRLLDEFAINTGFRKLSLKKNTLNVNGIPIPLKGITVFEERALTGNVLNQQSILNDIKLVKGLGANAVRFKQAPHPFWIQACDSLGLLCLIELPNVDVPAEILSKKTYTENSDLLLRELIKLTKYSPSVIAFGLGTGFDLSQPGAEKYLERLSELVKSNTNSFAFFSPKLFLPSSAYKNFDFIGISLLDNTLEHSGSMLESSLKTIPKSLPLLVTEYGSAPAPNNHNGYSDPASLEYQSKTILDHYNLFKTTNKKEQKLMGSLVYALSDYHYQIPPLKAAAYDDLNLATYGLTKLDRERKISYEMVKSLYADERVYNPAIGKTPQDFSPTLILIATLLTAGLVFLLNENRRIRENIVRALIRPFHLFMDIRDQRITYPQDPLILITLLSLLWGSILASLLYSTHNSFLLEFWLSHIMRTDWIKELSNYLVLTPEVATFVFGLIFFALSFLMCGLLSLYLFLIGKNKITYLQLMNLWAWVNVHWIFLIFIAAFIDRIGNEGFTTFIFYLCLAFFIFALYRLFHGLSIVANLPQTRTQLTGFIVILVFLLSVFFIFDHYYQTTAYIHYINHTQLN